MPKITNLKRLTCMLCRIFRFDRRYLSRKRTSCYFCIFLIIIIVVCDKYQNREALGNLCADLCELNYLRPNSCLPNHLGKDVVFEAKYFDDPVVVKSSKLHYEDFDQIFYEDKDGNQVHPSISMFLSMIVNTIQTNLDITVKPSDNQSLELLTKIWSRNMKNFNELPYSIQNAAMNNIWFLTQQTEYLLMKYYEDMNIFPKILGTCGPFYVVEYIQPLNNYFLMIYPSWEEDFKKRAELALKILNFLEETEKYFPLLHFCDVKMGHFGLDKNKNIKLLDMDMVFFESSLIQNIISVQNCTTDEDCSFVDCKGYCDVPLQKCHTKIMNNNFQRICTNILVSRLPLPYFGLLSLPPSEISEELHSILKRCSKQLDDKTAHIVASQLKHLLITVVNNS